MNDHQRYVLTFGPKDHRRCRIVDRDRVWTGEEWSADPRAARLYLDFQSAARDLQLVELYENIDQPSATYRGTVNVTVMGDSKMELAELQEFLVSSVKMSLTKPNITGQVVLVDIDWDELVEVES